MTYDIVCLLLLILAFIGGFQAGIIRIFGMAIACTFSALCTIWCAPYIKEFITASMTDVPVSALPIISAVLFVFIAWVMIRIITMLWNPNNYKTHQALHNIMGGAILSTGMLLSISILFGFVDKSSVLRTETKQESISYKILMPIHAKSKNIWTHLTAQTKNIDRDKSKDTI